MGRCIYLFAMKTDWKNLLEEFEAQERVSYVDIRACESKPKCLLTYKDIPNIGVTSAREVIATESYLCFPRGENIVPRKIDLLSGEVSWSLGQDLNPNSILFRFGGRLDEGTIISSEISTISGAPWSVRSIGALRKIMRTTNFTKVQGYQVGPECHEWLVKGLRLTDRAYSRKEFDLKLEGHTR